MIVKRVKKVLEWMVFGCLGFMLFVVLTSIVPTKKIIRSFVVTSGSMAPTVPAGSLVLVHPVPATAARVGDIIAFTMPDNPKTTVLHRIKAISTNPLTYQTKGDHNPAADTWTVPASNVIGTYIYGIPYIGYLAAFIRTKLGFGILIGIPVLYIIYTQIRLIIDGIEEEIQKRAKNAPAESPTTRSNILPLFFAGIVVGSIAAIGIRHIGALFVTQATIQGMSISVENGVTPTPTPTAGTTPTPTPTPTCPQNITIISSGSSSTTSIAVANTGGNIASGSGSITTGNATAESSVHSSVNNITVTCSQ